MDERRTAPSPDRTLLAEQPVRLVARIGGRETGSLLLERGSAVVGSAPECSLVVDHSTVSRRHAEFTVRPGGVAVRDLGSTNGTRYQGSVIRDAVVGLGAMLILGDAEVLLEAALPAQKKLGPLSSVAPSMVATIEQLRRAAGTDSTVLLEGETGAGKEVAARALHDASPRSGRPLEVVDCGALQKDLAGSELFGHVKGAFTGAGAERAGAFERAGGGTVFLDEVGELPASLQPLLLRALERREVRRIGDGAYRPVDVRIVAATNRDLAAEVAAGRFRTDLWHRLAVVRIRLPPLRERLEDLPTLARSLLDGLGQRARGVCLSHETLDALRNYPWPGNVREMKNLFERALALSDDRTIDVKSLGLPILAAEMGLDYRAARDHALDAFERDFVVFLLRRCGRNVSRAARGAGITRAYLQKLMKKHGVTRADL